MRTQRLVVIVAACLSTVAGVWAAEPPAKEAVKPKPARPKITISKETTYITGPLRPDGYPDYLAALNAHCSRGVTPENNAAVPFWQAVGPKSIPAALRPQFFKMLGIEELPEKGAYIVSLGNFVWMKKEPGKEDTDDAETEELMERLWVQLDRAESQPWSGEEYPVLFAWLTVNELPLQRIVDGVKRPRFYTPRVTEDDRLIEFSVFLAGNKGVREIGHLLRSRAMLRLKAGKADEAWQDLLVCHGLTRLWCQQPFLTDQLVANLIETLTCQNDVVLAHEERLTARQAAKFLADLDKLPPLPNAATILSGSERYLALDFVLLLCAEGGEGPFSGNFLKDSAQQKATDDAITNLIADPRVDWDAVLREVNTGCDRLIRAHQKATHKQRLEAIAAEVKATAEREREATKPAALAKSAAKDAAPQEIGRQLGTLVWAALDGPYESYLIAEIKHHAHLSLSRLAFALAGYRADRGKYPASLADLKPKYIAEIPKDLFTDKDLIYRPQDGGQGYVLYSVGPNGRDDGGLNANDDWENNENVEFDKRPDDVAIRTPAAAGGKAKQ